MDTKTKFEQNTDEDLLEMYHTELAFEYSDSTQSDFLSPDVIELQTEILRRMKKD